MENLITYDNTEEPMFFYPKTLELLYATEKPTDVVALYIMYYAKSKWGEQKTAKEMDNEIIKEGFSKSKLLKTKKILLDLHLIEESDDCTCVHLFPY